MGVVEHGGTDELRRKSKIIKGQHQKCSTFRDTSFFDLLTFPQSPFSLCPVTPLGCGPSMSQLDPGRDDGKSARPGMQSMTQCHAVSRSVKICHTSRERMIQAYIMYLSIYLYIYIYIYI